MNMGHKSTSTLHRNVKNEPHKNKMNKYKYRVRDKNNFTSFGSTMVSKCASLGFPIGVQNEKRNMVNEIH
jgi:hypothetical protein